MQAALRQDDRPTGSLRIGELARRAGVSPELLRAWERRYGVLQPERTEGGFRLYSADDEARVEAMKAHMAGGLSAAEAARAVLAGAAVDGAPTRNPEAPELETEQAKSELADALGAYEESTAQEVIDRLLATFSLDTVLAGVVLPLLHDIGEGWERGQVTVGQEHFASNVLRGRLIALARGWDRGAGPRAILACAPGEAHDLALVCHGLALRARGWRIAYLGADTPVETLAETVEQLAPDAVVLAVEIGGRLEPHVADLRPIAARTQLAIGGHGATVELAARLGALYLNGDAVVSADVLTERLAEAR